MSFKPDLGETPHLDSPPPTLAPSPFLLAPENVSPGGILSAPSARTGAHCWFGPLIFLSDGLIVASSCDG